MGHLDGSVLQYSNHFWGDKHHGFQVLYENTKKGEESAQELSIFIKERLQLEDEYSKMLVKSMNKVVWIKNFFLKIIKYLSIILCNCILFFFLFRVIIYYKTYFW